MQPLTAGLELAGRFRLIRLLGSGGHGEVWLAETGADARRVALKFPATEAVTADALRAEFDQMRRLVHPGIVRVHELVAGPPPFMVMDYVEGPSLGALRGSGFRAVVQALIPVAEALEYAHRQGVVHRDLKPSNVLRDARGHFLIADFGVGSRPGGGSLPAMSPQQCDGAAPAVSDDVYAFGSLLYDLIAGQPLFHPDVTPERIRGEVPVVPAADLAGDTLPQGLRLLLGSLLQKAPQQRAPGMGAVRDALEQILRDSGDAAAMAGAGVIRPRERSRPAEGPDQRLAASGPAVAIALPSARPGMRTTFVYVGLALLVPIALLVIVYLPTIVRERGPPLKVDPPAAATSRAAGEPVAAPVAPGAPPPVPQAVVDETLGAFLHDDDELRKVGADKWGGPDWTELRRLAQVGDDANRVRDTGAALAGYRAAAALAKRLLARAPEVLAESLHSGAAALKAGDQAQAIAQFQTALSVAADNAEARRGLERAQKLDQVLAVMTQANAAESAGRRSEALALFRRAAALDPAWSEAGAGIARLELAAARETYETQMARGFAAQAGKDLVSARAAFDAALRARPGDAQAQAALAQLESDQKLARLVGLQAEARTLEQQERWADAAQRYEAVLAEDANLQQAQLGLARSRSRADLDGRLRRELGNADQLNDDTVFRKASAVLESARLIQDPGPVLSQQVADLDRLLQVAAKPVPVQLESDNLTEVTVFKVGRLGAFSSKTLELRPGAYVAVGSRPGYRDVRRNFRVAPGADGAPVVVRCEEAI